ncbi:MAG: amidohydrolase family protein [Spirochaetales bacterium]|jgi:N-acetylglucosamine-6-phosphate deacetylase|nr:amidohydrolase family protein [Spirochaetales bacterium]
MAESIYLKGGDLILEDRVSEKTDLLIKDGTIAAIGRELSAQTDLSGVKEIDASGHYIGPGYIDMHVHGTREFLIDRGANDLAGMCSTLPEYGVTGFLPTVLPLVPGKDTALLKSLAKVQSTGASMLGFFLEGPFVALTGAIPPDALGSPTRKRIESLIDAVKPYRAIFAVSPDLKGVIDLIPLMANQDAASRTAVFMTHTAASVKETQDGIAAGISHATHFYDVFPAPEETDPGVRPCGAVEAILADPTVSVDFILDGEHVDPIAVKMALECKGPGGVCLVTDANLGAALPPGKYDGLGGQQIEFAYAGAPARICGSVHNAGSLAGSGLTMDRAVRNAVSMVSADIPQAVRMGATNPAKVVGMESSKGSIKLGYDADVLILDRELNVQTTFVQGKSVFSA